MKLDDLIVYRLAMDIADEIWLLVEKWDAFAKWTTGKQLVESADSMAANISEGYGRYYFKENRQSVFLAWLTIRNHHLVDQSEKPWSDKRGGVC